MSRPFLLSIASISAIRTEPIPAVRRPLRLPLMLLMALASAPSGAFGQRSTGLLTSRADLVAAAEHADNVKDHSRAAAIRTRLRDGDFQVGDRIVVTVFSEQTRIDTVVVEPGKVIRLLGNSVVPLDGVLRSEAKERIASEVLRYVKAVDVDVVPLTRIGVLGEVTRPGYFAVRFDVPITDAIMLAGGPTSAASIDNTVIRRANQRLRSADETRQALANGLTLDQFGLNAGDELIVGRQRQWLTTTVPLLAGLAASLAATFLALHNR